MKDGELIRIVTGHNIDQGQHPITEFRDLKNEKGEDGADKYIDYIDIICTLSCTAAGGNDMLARHMFQWIGPITLILHGQKQPYVDQMDGWQLRQLYRDRFGIVPFTDPATVTSGQSGQARTVVIRIPFKGVVGEKGQDAKVHASAIKSIRISRTDSRLPGSGDIVTATADFNIKLCNYHKTVVPVEVTLEAVDITDLRRVDVEGSDKLHYLAVVPLNGALTDTTTVDLFNSKGDQLTDDISFRELNRMANVDCIVDAASRVNEAGTFVEAGRLVWEEENPEDRRWTHALANPTGFVAKTSANLTAGDQFIAIRSWARPAKGRTGRQYLRHARGIRNPERVAVVAKNTARKTQPRPSIHTSGIPEVVESR